MALKRLLLIRPGETDWNLYGRWQGWVASPLNEHGRAQVQRLGNFIRNVGMQAIYSSDNQRAIDTANILAEVVGVEPTFDARLRERSIGHWQGLILPEIRAWYSDEYEQLIVDPDGFEVPGGESIKQVEKRATAVLKEIVSKEAQQSKNRVIGVISHTTAIRVMLRELVPDADVSNQVFGNTSVTSLVYEDNTWRLTSVNDCEHLEGLESRFMPEVEEKQP